VIERATLLVELGTEELPPKSLRELERAFCAALVEGLGAAGVPPARFRTFASPRRLALLAEGVSLRQPDRVVERRGPPVKAAFDAEGRPTRAALAFAQSCGVELAELGRTESAKGAWLCYSATEAGRETAELLEEIVQRAVAGLPVPRRMRWGSGDDEFVRPAHWLVLLLNDRVVTARVLGLEAGRITRGHRFLAPEPLEIATAREYSDLLESRGRVIADFAARRERIVTQARAAAAAVGGEVVLETDVVDEVTALTEWPVAMVGGFEGRFLELPPEVLAATLQDHQRYFPMQASGGALLPLFIAVANLDSLEPAQVRAGNERVVRPRLADAAFFWDADRRRTLAEREPELAGVVFQARLGTMADKAQRVTALARLVASRIGCDEEIAARAARLAKTDLLTQMVGEFPELQGVMARYYALHDGELPALAQALEEQYLPRFAGDRLPPTPAGQALAIADRLDTIAGSFAIGSRPTGNKDPFGLRRGALGVLRIMIECELELDLTELLEQAARAQPVAGARVDEIYEFMMERLRAYYLDSAQDMDASLFDAVLARRPTSPLDFDRRLRAVRQFVRLEASASLASANKRIANILRQAGEPELAPPDPTRFTETAEAALHEQLQRQRTAVTPLLTQGRYAEALERLAGLRAVVDEFFDRVLVMTEDTAVRSNRLALLSELRRLFLHTADLSRLQMRAERGDGSS
jgi:glycyl-tRNA synthetase beta chain